VRACVLAGSPSWMWLVVGRHDHDDNRERLTKMRYSERCLGNYRVRVAMDGAGGRSGKPLSSVFNTQSSKHQVARRRGGRAQAPQHARRMSVAVFDSIQAALSADSKLGPKVGGSLQFLLTGGHGGDSTWVVDCKQSKVSRGAGKADCTVTLSEENFMALASGKLQGMQAFMAGKMKIKGNMSLAQKVGLLF
jgi:putative sterol carrier protein